MTSDEGPLDGQTVAFALGDQRRKAQTGDGGAATVSFSLLGRPGETQVRASFAGAAGYAWSEATSPFTITKQPTVLTLLPESMTVLLGTSMQFSVTLTDGQGRPLLNRTVFVIASGDEGSRSFVESTDYLGEISFGELGLPNGNYDLNTYFLGTIPIPGQEPQVLEDPNYLSSTASAELTIDRLGPIRVSSEVIAVGTTVSATAVFTEQNDLGGYSAEWDWGDFVSVGTVSDTISGGIVTGSHTYTEPGVYTVRLTVTLPDLAQAVTVFRYVTVYNPEGQFVTGGGWIESPEGACRLAGCEDATGKAHFGFVAKYKKGAKEPTGRTQFRFKAGDLLFESTSYQWLVVTKAKAQFKGQGAIDGWAGSYGFLISVIDADLTSSADVDRFRIKIWDRAVDDDSVVYDNQMGDVEDADPTTEIGAGSIKIQRK